MAWLARGTPQAADRYQQAQHAAARAVAEAKILVWEKFGETMEEDYRWVLKRIWRTTVKMKKESYQAWLAHGTPQAADRSTMY